ncbi:hypothetical protein Nepgr_018523 [Nepenthes gracilis]|uniref:Uncharacterized protein n=1 Tax=Nepenthes gracilis TaxID=150966 RepID=A0AAD3SU65_NEPGR|nr:hypothetical protein Nepgr_018523 [Nepenthes gracilis]
MEYHYILIRSMSSCLVSDDWLASAVNPKWFTMSQYSELDEIAGKGAKVAGARSPLVTGAAAIPFYSLLFLF